MPLSPEFIAEYGERSNGMQFLGEPIESYSREELIAILGYAHRQHEATRERMTSVMRIISPATQTP